MINTTELLESVFINTAELGCNRTPQCVYKERSLSYATGVTVPVPTEDPDEVFRQCCYRHYVYADLNSSTDFKNDYSSFYHQRQLLNESVDFELEEIATGTLHALNDDTYGTYYGFGGFDTNVNLKGVLIQWKNVLNLLGPGPYRIIKTVTVAGVTIEYPSIAYNLSQYSSARADHSVRIDVVMNGFLEETGDDFTGTSWKHSIRLPGFFGRREFQFEEDNLIKRDFEIAQISMKQSNEYKFQTNYIPDCLTNEIANFFLFGNDIFMNDYNLNNHSYNYIKFGVKFASNDGTEYLNSTRKARLNLTFTDKFDNKLKRNYR